MRELWSVRLVRVPLEECREPGLAWPLRRVIAHGTAVIAEFPKDFAQLLPRDAQAVPAGVDEQVFDGRSSTAVSTAFGSGLAATATLPAMTLFAI